MDTFLSRYRNLSVLLALVLAQLLLLAYQVKAREDVRLIRIWAVTAITPLARGIEWARGGAGGFFGNWVYLRGVEQENQRLRRELGELKLKHQLMASELATADRAKPLLEFRSHAPSKMLAVRVIGTGTGANSRVVYVDRGSVDGLKKGMAAVTPDGIVGRVVAAYPTAALVQFITEDGSVVGVISQVHKVRGILKGKGTNNCIVENIQNEEKLDEGEWFYTSGADRIYPRGLPVGQVKMVKEGRGGKEVVVSPSGLTGTVEEMLVVLDGVHTLIPDPPPPTAPEVSILPPPPGEAATPVVPSAAGEQPGVSLTDADRLREKYRRQSEPAARPAEGAPAPAAAAGQRTAPAASAPAPARKQ